MKKYILSTVAVLSAAVSFTACDDMLDTDPRVTEMTQATFPGKPADVEALNAGVYAVMNTMGGGDADTQNPYYWWEVMSDNCFGSGGLQDNKIKALHHLTQMSTNQYSEPFNLLYTGMSRATNMIETIDNVNWKGQESRRNQLLGEAYFMRGLYTLLLTQMYGDVPLITSTTITEEMKQQVSAEEVIYPQILSDFVSGKTLMSTEKKSGHANKYVAEAYIARAYMFWAGFYKGVTDLTTGGGPAITLNEQEGCQGGQLSQSDVANGLEDIISSKQYKLLDDYRSLWQYSNTLVYDETQKALETGEGMHYDFIADMDREHCFDMPGMGNGNDEELFQVQFMNASSWGIGQDGSTARMYCNYLSVFWALRVNGTNGGDLSHTYPFNQGWGQGTPSNNIWDDWTIAERDGDYTDARKLGSLIDGFSDSKEIDYDFVKDCCEASGLGVKKYNGVGLSTLGGDKPWWDAAPGFAASSLDNPMQGDHFEDFYLMRYADVLLMAAELKGNADYLNQVRKRGLGYLLADKSNPNAGKEYVDVPATLANIQLERRWEFAFEGLRFNDLRRWTGKGTKGGLASKALQAQAGKQMVVKGDTGNKVSMKHMTCSWSERYEATDGFLMKPQSQITLMNGNLIQNEGWDASDPKTQYVDLYN